VATRGAHQRRDQARAALVAEGVQPRDAVSGAGVRGHELHAEPAAVRQPLDERRRLLGERQRELAVDVMPARARMSAVKRSGLSSTPASRWNRVPEAAIVSASGAAPPPSSLPRSTTIVRHPRSAAMTAAANPPTLAPTTISPAVPVAGPDETLREALSTIANHRRMYIIAACAGSFASW